ncbi:deoxyribose-phosphate aldolase [Flavihumibacter petaseus]|uniref:Deoxyribose-phosphate aldolase n=1 Tax=Flavihumibacter petaseus NBRC 106054 TaxID=1220578 RepID=A0A0E9N4P5_9BACT|nr:deoxyribose-phosphate aldolase [Flavihumibacter petaseus]GAO44804.1 deoxyribose-phosphate aldolase [Flavihumibacter petaseus NBRC 106054]
MNLAACIDHTVLKPTTTIQDVEKCCREAVEFGFAAVCLPPSFVKRAATILAPTDVKVATVVGFPFGYSATEAKVAETILALVDGAQEIDMVINLIALRQNDWAYLVKEVNLLREVCHNKGRLIKVIIESGILSDDEIIGCCEKLGALGIDFMKTSTGYAEKGATLEAVQLMRKHLPPGVKIKASGGIRDYAFAKALVDAGASRLGCSASVAIVTGAPDHQLGNY